MSSARPSKNNNPSILSSKRQFKDIKNAKVKYNAIKSTPKTPTNNISNSKSKKINEKTNIPTNQHITPHSNPHDARNDEEEDDKSVCTNDTNVSDEGGEQTTNANRPDYFYQAIQNNYEYIHDESPSTCLLMPSPVSVTTKFNSQHTVSFSDFSRTLTNEKDARIFPTTTSSNLNLNNNLNNNNLNNNNYHSNNLNSNHHHNNNHHNNSDENPIFISSYEDILLAKKYQQQQQQHNNSHNNTHTLPSWPHFITGVLASILVISLLSITLSSFCLYKMVLISEYNLDEINKTSSVMNSLVYQFGEMNSLVGSEFFESINNLSAVVKARQTGCRVNEDEGENETRWMPREDELHEDWSVTGVFCSFIGQRSVSLQTNQDKSRHRCVCEEKNDDEDMEVRSCIIHYWMCHQ